MLATPKAFEKDPALVWLFYAWRRHLSLTVEPNAGHYALAELAKKKDNFLCLTQNVDGECLTMSSWCRLFYLFVNFLQDFPHELATQPKSYVFSTAAYSTSSASASAATSKRTTSRTLFAQHWNQPPP